MTGLSRTTFLLFKFKTNFRNIKPVHIMIQKSPRRQKSFKHARNIRNRNRFSINTAETSSRDGTADPGLSPLALFTLSLSLSHNVCGLLCEQCAESHTPVQVTATTLDLITALHMPGRPGLLGNIDYI